MKYKSCVVKHFFHPFNKIHKCCPFKIYMYLGLVQAYSNEVTAFYFKHFAFDKQPLGNNMFNNMLPLLCKEPGFKHKTSHSLRVTCASSLFNAGVEE